MRAEETEAMAAVQYVGRNSPTGSVPHGHILHSSEMEAKTDTKMDEDDEIVGEFDVFISQQMPNQLYLLQYPLRPSWRPYDLEQLKTIRMKKPLHKMEMDFRINTKGENYNKEWKDKVRVRASCSPALFVLLLLLFSAALAGLGDWEGRMRLLLDLQALCEGILWGPAWRIIPQRPQTNHRQHSNKCRSSEPMSTCAFFFFLLKKVDLQPPSVSLPPPLVVLQVPSNCVPKY